MARSDNDALKLALGKPDFKSIDATRDDYTITFYQGLFYTHNVVDSKLLKKDAILYATAHHPEIDTKVLGKLPDARFDSVGKFCYMINRGAKLRETDAETIHRILLSLTAISQDKIDDEPDDTETTKPSIAKVVGIQDYMREKASETCGEFEELFDAYCAAPDKVKLDLDPKALMVNAGLKAGHLRYVAKFYEPMLSELNEALSGEDKELRDAYGFLTKPQLRKFIAYVQSIIDSATHMKNANVTSRKPRKKKAIDISKLVSKLKYLDEADGTKSVNPVHIVGAKAVWVYNTRTRKIGCYEAHDESGLSVKGTSIKSFSDSSVERTIRKGSNFDIKKFAAANKSNRRKVYKELTSLEVKMKGRMNEHTLILAVDK